MVMLRSAWPRSSLMVMRSAPLITMWLAKVCRVSCQRKSYPSHTRYLTTSPAV